MPAPKNNLNRRTHGIRSFLSTGRVSDDARRCKVVVNAMRREVEREIEDRKGHLGLYDAALVQQAARSEMAVQLIFKWLAEQGDKLDVETRLRLLAEVRRFTESRNGALEKTGIGRDAKSRTIDAIYAADNSTDATE